MSGGHVTQIRIGFIVCTGSSLIGVFNSSLPQKVLGTPGWGAPESLFELEPPGLRKQDVYSFGLLVWAITLNGVKPWHMLTRVADNVIEVVNSTEPVESHSELTYIEFDGLKATNHGDLLLKLAKETLEQCHPGDVDYSIVQHVLDQTLGNDLDQRAPDFGNIISMLRNCTSLPA